ncbi:MAG: hypothetical protein LBI48_01925 [Burkholderiaceae bacterium]|jgi:ureidoglycolate hydrolase|nr:hypothetical protein [Burkholderiaceae bacterium]
MGEKTSPRFEYLENHPLSGQSVIDYRSGRVWSIALCREFADVVNAHRTDKYWQKPAKKAGWTPPAKKERGNG